MWATQDSNAKSSFSENEVRRVSEHDQPVDDDQDVEQGGLDALENRQVRNFDPGAWRECWDYNGVGFTCYPRGVTPIRGASCVAMGFRLSLSGSTFGLVSHGCGVSGSAYTMRLELRTPVTLP